MVTGALEVRLYHNTFVTNFTSAVVKFCDRRFVFWPPHCGTHFFCHVRENTLIGSDLSDVG